MKLGEMTDGNPDSNPGSLFDDISALAEFALSECSYYYFVLTLGRYIPEGLKNYYYYCCCCCLLLLLLLLLLNDG